MAKRRLTVSSGAIVNHALRVHSSRRYAKYLNGSPHYLVLDARSSEWSNQVTLADREEVVGVYQNVPGKLEDSILITTRGIHHFAPGNPQFVAYKQIADVQMASDDKAYLQKNAEARRLIIVLRNNNRISLPVTGASGRGSDMASFHNFLLGTLRP